MIGLILMACRNLVHLRMAACELKKERKKNPEKDSEVNSEPNSSRIEPSAKITESSV